MLALLVQILWLGIGKERLQTLVCLIWPYSSYSNTLLLPEMSAFSSPKLAFWVHGVEHIARKVLMFYWWLSDTEKDPDLCYSVPAPNFPGKRMIGPAFDTPGSVTWAQGEGLTVETMWIYGSDPGRGGLRQIIPCLLQEGHTSQCYSEDLKM